MGSTTNADEIRVIENNGAPTRFARGWHCLGLLRDFADGQPHQVKAFGTELVVFRGESGSISVLNAFCPHMGGNLAMGTVKGDTIACPFHDWRWNGKGRCEDVPYARRVPPLARTKAWPTLERNGQLFVWNDPQGSQPTDDVTIPEIAGFGDPAWTGWTWNTMLVEGSNCREIVDNVVDMAHFFYVHYGMPQYFRNVFEGHVATQEMGTRPRQDAVEGAVSTNYDSENRSDASYYGPSYMIDYLWTDETQVDPNVVLINCHYPVTPTSFVLQYGAIVKKPAGMPDEAAQQMAEGLASAVAIGFEQDIEIWKNKASIDNPLLSEEDGPVYQLRRWYKQFYVDVEDIEPAMVDRFEFEIDTERALQSWQAEVDANVAAGRSPIRAAAQ